MPSNLLLSLCGASELNSEQYPLSIPLIDRLIEDRWFSRSWTLQEYICACRVVLLITWDQKFAETHWDNWRDEFLPSLIGLEDKIDSGDLQETYGEWSISERLWSYVSGTCLQGWECAIG